MIKSVTVIWSLVLAMGIIISPASAESPKDKAKPETPLSIQSTSDDLMSLNFFDVDIREVLSALALQREINVVAAPEVSGQISLHLFDVTLNQALEAVCSAGGFGYYKKNGMYFVSKLKEDEEAKPGDFEIRIFTLQYAEIDKIQDILNAVPDIRMVKIHEPTRTVIVEDTIENIERIASIIRYWDTMPKQVMIEAKILEIRLTDGMELGVEWDKILGDARVATSSFSDAVNRSETNPDVSPVPDVGSGIFGNYITGVGTSRQFAMALDALKTKTSVNGLSTPRVLSIHGKPARVQIGGQQGYRVTTVNDGVSQETIEFIDTGIVLDITAYIDDKETILLKVEPSITSAELEEGIPVTNTALVNTSLLVKSGETVFIGGLIQDVKTKTKDAVPVLGSIPGLGVLFGRNTRDIDKTEIVVLITPQIVTSAFETVKPQMQEKFDKWENRIEKEPLPDHKQLFEILRSDDYSGP
jgi:type IV pilus secretin PilQ/predicted competence protein